MKNCIFCNIKDRDIILENKLALCVLDLYPVTEGHSLVIPRRHFPGFFSITDPEYRAVKHLLEERRNMLLSEDPAVEGFNIGVNVGEAGGQTVDHCHVHIIPRRRGDTENPAGGVRGVIPEKRTY